MRNVTDKTIDVDVSNGYGILGIDMRDCRTSERAERYLPSSLEPLASITGERLDTWPRPSGTLRCSVTENTAGARRVLGRGVGGEKASFSASRYRYGFSGIAKVKYFPRSSYRMRLAQRSSKTGDSASSDWPARLPRICSMLFAASLQISIT